MVTKEELDKYIKAYQEGNPIITDEEYDTLLEEYLNIHGESARPFTRNKQSDDVNELVGTLPKVYGVETPARPNMHSYKDWIQNAKLTANDIIIQPKFDGCSVAFDFQTQRFFTRGDYDDGESVDVTDVFKSHIDKIKWYAEPGTTAMKFEAILSHEIFNDKSIVIQNKKGERFKRPRDVVAATITSRSQELAKLITLIPLRGYINNRQYIPKALASGLSVFISTPESYDEIQNFIDEKLKDNATVKFHDQTFSIDGVVASEVNVNQSIDKNKPLHTYPNNEVAIKILTLVKETKLISVDFQFGKQGRITPVAILQPVMFDNVKVDHVTLSTLDRIVNMGLCHNDTVTIMYNIVPYLIDSFHDGDYPIQVPKKCPICGAELDYRSLKQVRCSNPDCKGLRLGSIIRYAEKMKMFGVSKGIITRLYDEGIIESIVDLYTLKDKRDIISNLEGFGLQSWGNLVTSIEKASLNVPPARFLGALPINDTSASTWENILSVMGSDTISSLRQGTFVEKIMSIGYIPNVGELKLRKIIDGVMRHQDEINKLIDIILPNLLWETRQPFTGKIAMTGTRDAEVIRILEEEGYTIGSFTNDCVALIVPNHDFVSAKTQKAKQLNIPIYDLDQIKFGWLSKPF